MNQRVVRILDETFIVPDPETIEEVFEAGMVADEESLVKLVVSAWICRAWTAYFGANIHPDDYVYEYSGRRNAHTLPREDNE
jgi:hypothetical protein